VVSAEARTRVVDAIETAYRESGEAIFEIPETEANAAAGPPRHADDAVCAAV